MLKLDNENSNHKLYSFTHIRFKLIITCMVVMKMEILLCVHNAEYAGWFCSSFCYRVGVAFISLSTHKKCLWCI